MVFVRSNLRLEQTWIIAIAGIDGDGKSAPVYCFFLTMQGSLGSLDAFFGVTEIPLLINGLRSRGYSYQLVRMVVLLIVLAVKCLA